MTRRLFLAATALACALVLAPAAHAAQPMTLAVIGDMPYDAAQRAWMPSLIADINADPAVATTIHVGDIKSGSTTCTDERFADVKGLFDTFERPLVYTPGDNEWTDCHRANNGGYVPTERLAKIRQLFFPQPGVTLGQAPMAVAAQDAPYVEDVRWEASKVVLATLDIPGSNNDLAPWFGAPAPGTDQLGEALGRTAAVLDWIDAAFDAAESGQKAEGVVLALQADMWDPTAQLDGFDTITRKISERAAAFGRPVLLLEGDSHAFRVDQPFTPGSALYGVHPGVTPAPNVTRIVIEGSAPSREWLRLTLDPRGQRPLFSWTRVPVAG